MTHLVLKVLLANIILIKKYNKIQIHLWCVVEDKTNNNNPE